MSKNPQATKPKKPPKDNNTETSDNEFTFSFPSYSSLFGTGEPQATKPSKGKDTIETSEDEFLATLPTLPTSPTSPTFSSSSLPPSPCPSREDVEKKNRRKRRQSSSENRKENQNQRRRLLIPKPISASIPSSTSSPKQHLQMALYNLNQAYIGLKEEEEEEKEQVKLLGDYV